MVADRRNGLRIFANGKDKNNKIEVLGIKLKLMFYFSL
jgi:hypothetical protein